MINLAIADKPPTPDFATITYPSPILTPSTTKIHSNFRVHNGCGKTRMSGLQSDEGLMMIDSAVWAQYINVTDRQTAASTQYASGSKN